MAMIDATRRQFIAALAGSGCFAIFAHSAPALAQSEIGAGPRAKRQIPDDSPPEWRAVIAAYANLKSYRDEMNGTAVAPFRVAFRMRTSFVAPRSFRHEIEVAGQSKGASFIYVHDGSRSWEYEPDAGWQSSKSLRNLTSGLFGAAIPFGGQGYWTLSLMIPEEDLAYASLRTLAGVTMEGNDNVGGEECRIFTGQYRRRDQLRIWASAKDQLIRRIDVRESGSESSRVTYKVDPNPAVSTHDLVRASPGEIT